MKKKTYFKVVKIHSKSKKLVSCTLAGNRAVTYIPGEFVSAEVGCIFVFKNLRAAKDFVTLNSYYRCEIWECEAMRPRPMNRMLNLRAAYFNYTFLEFWKKRMKMKDTHIHTRRTPMGTMIADSVKLTERVR